ncbi:uncharacterized protein TNCV_246251 [Trichonephila clavipes]|nr:uncharacterized protein TNCV_246251 [Trichonephila clavipes]
MRGPDHPQGVLPHNWGGMEPNHFIICLVLKAKTNDRCKTSPLLSMNFIVRVQYFVRGGFVGHHSRASSKHLSSHLPVDGVRFLGGQKGLRCSCKMHVWVSGPTKMPTTLNVRRNDVTALALSCRTFPLRKV